MRKYKLSRELSKLLKQNLILCKFKYAVKCLRYIRTKESINRYILWKTAHTNR